MRKAQMFFCAIMLGGQLVAAQEVREYPLLLHADAPLYPALARMAKIAGKIDAEFTVKGGEVLTAGAKSGHPLLVNATTENIKTWRFGPDVNGSFRTIFEYRLEGRETQSMQNAKIEMQLPVYVKITASPTRQPCNDCEPGAGPDIIGKPTKQHTTVLHEIGHSGVARSRAHLSTTPRIFP